MYPLFADAAIWHTVIVHWVSRGLCVLPPQVECHIGKPASQMTVCSCNIARKACTWISKSKIILASRVFAEKVSIVKMWVQNRKDLYVFFGSC